ncbi:zinc finger protein MAGPIE-like [Silene latifolia]|uniref:zinc finger protein MAGPIE-like n=1 Tax=Silene latifolia TaxID=37657 RepID=UPI003D76AA6E
MTTNRFLCEICGKGFQRDQNLQLHRRGHNLPWKLKQRTSKEPRKRVYVCPEKTCVHNHPSRALGDLTGIKKHFFRKHGQKKWKCEKCNKKYAVHSDCKAHSKTCGTREYKCDCGTIFSRRDSFITHRAFCDALAEETARMNGASTHFSLNTTGTMNNNLNYQLMGSNMSQHFSSIFKPFSSITTTTTKDETLDLQTQSGVLPFWLGNQLAPTKSNYDNMHHQLNNTTNSFNPQNTPLMLVPGSNLLPDNNGYSPLSWVFGSKISSSSLNNIYINGGELGAITNITSNNNTTSSIPSLYSTQHVDTQTSSSNSSHFMSATALLQKAAQIGANISALTTTSNDALFLGNFAFSKEHNIINNTANGNGNGNSNSNSNCDDGSVYGTSNSTTTNLGSDIEGSGSVHNLSTMYNPTKRQKLQNEYQENYIGGVGNNGGQTRDFLGVSSEANCHPTSVNGWI